MKKIMSLVVGLMLLVTVNASALVTGCEQERYIMDNYSEDSIAMGYICTNYLCCVLDTEGRAGLIKAVEDMTEDDLDITHEVMLLLYLTSVENGIHNKALRLIEACMGVVASEWCER
jgi:hypothetical protein